MKKKLILAASVAIVAAAAASCGTKDIKYDTSLDVKEVHCKTEVMNREFMFDFPRDMFVINETIAVYDMFADDYRIHFFSKSTGDYLGGAIRKGRGPGELTMILSLNLSPDGRLVAFDPNLKKLVILDLSGDEMRVSEQKLPEETKNVSQVLPLPDGKYLMKGTTGTMRFGIYDPETDEVKSLYDSYPAVDSDEEICWSIFDYAYNLRLSPDPKRLVGCTYAGSIIESFSIEDGRINPDRSAFIVKPVFTFAQGATPKYVALDDDSTIGTEELFVTDDGCYALMWNVISKDMDNVNPPIVFFDKKLKPLYKMVFDDGQPQTFTIGPDGTMYMVMLDEDGELFLARKR